MIEQAGLSEFQRGLALGALFGVWIGVVLMSVLFVAREEWGSLQAGARLLRKKGRLAKIGWVVVAMLMLLAYGVAGDDKRTAADLTEEVDRVEVMAWTAREITAPALAGAPSLIKEGDWGKR